MFDTRVAGGAKTNERSARRSYIFAVAAAIAIPLFIFLNPQIEPSLIFLTIVLLALLVRAISQFPAVFLVPVMFIPQLKDMPKIQFIQRRADLTVVFLIVLSVVLLYELVLAMSQADGWSVGGLLAGQGRGMGAFFSFAAIVAGSYLYTPAPDYGWIKLGRFLVIGGLLFLAPFVLVKEEKDFRHFAIAFLCFAMVLATETITRLGFRNPHPSTETDVTRIGTGWVLGMAILVALYYRVVEHRLPRLLLKLFCVSWLMAGLVAAASRGPILSLAFVVGITSLVMGQRKGLLPRLKVWLVVMTILFACGAVSFYWIRRVPEAEARYQAKVSELMALSRGSATQGSAVTRLRFYKTALAEVSERPLLGLGVGGWSVYEYGRDQREYPHNLFLEAAAEEGLLGLAVLLVFLGTVASTVGWILKTSGDRFIVIFSVLTFSLAVSMFSGDLDDHRLLWLWCGMAFAIWRMVESWPVHSPFACRTRYELKTAVRIP